MIVPVGSVPHGRILDSDELNEGINRLSVEEHEILAPILGNVENQQEFRKNIRQAGRQKVQ
jgi:hypothetical protein